MKATSKVLFALAVCLALTSLPASAKPNHGRSKAKNHDVSAENDNRDQARDGKWSHDPTAFSAHDRESIRNYYRNGSNLPPGLAKRNGNLPPGLRKQLQRNGTLPPGLQKRFQPLPADVERNLPALSGNYSRGYIGQDVLIVDNRTQRIVDIISNVIGPR